MKSKGRACLLAFFFGGFGVHKFYLEKPGVGVLYALFFWTLIPSLFAFIDLIIMLCTPDEIWKEKYGS